MTDTKQPVPAKITEAIERYRQRTGFAAFEPRAALIDMDGTLFDSMKYHTLAWKRLISELGIPCTRDEFYLYEGMSGPATIEYLFKREGRPALPPEEVKRLYAVKTGYFNEMPPVEPIPGAARMLHVLMDAGVKRVLVTGSGQLSVINSLDKSFPGAFSADLMITSHNTKRCKPAPDPYLCGMKLAGVEPWQSIVVENAPLGVISGHDAKGFTVAVTTGPIPAEKMAEAGADLICHDMDEFADLLPYLLNKPC